MTKVPFQSMKINHSNAIPESSKKSTLKRKKSTAILSSDEEEENLPPRKKSAPKASASKPRASTSQIKRKKRDEDDNFDMGSESASDDDEFVEEEEDVKPQKRKTPVKKSNSSKIDKPKTPAKEKPSQPKEAPKKFECVLLLEFSFQPSFFSRDSWAAKKAAQLAGPVAHGSKEVPDGVPDALAGLSFVFTGELSSFSREEAIDLGKRFGGFVIFP